MKKCLIDGCNRKYHSRKYCRKHYRKYLVNGDFGNGKLCLVDRCKKKTMGINGNICRSHYRRKIGEGRRSYLRERDDEGLSKRRKEIYRKWYSQVRKTPYMREKGRIQSRKAYYRVDGKRKKYLREWKNSLSSDKLREYRSKDNATRHFGSWKLREDIIQRDGEKCIKCGITRKEHKKRWKKDLTVDHKDNYGRNIVRQAKNNRPENLETLCIRCHRSKSAKEQWDKRREEFLLYGKDFTEDLRERIRERDNRKCKKCGLSEKDNKRKLDIHHISGNKHDNWEENLESRCIKCNRD